MASTSYRWPQFIARKPVEPAPARARRPVPVTERRPRDWVHITVTALPGLAAVIALMFSYLAVRATGTQLQITEQGQITDRFNAAITDLGSASTDTRVGCISGFPSNRGDFLIADSCNFAASSEYRTPVHFVS
jgi:hypothetical protein